MNSPSSASQFCTLLVLTHHKENPLGTAVPSPWAWSTAGFISCNVKPSFQREAPGKHCLVLGFKSIWSHSLSFPLSLCSPPSGALSTPHPWVTWMTLEARAARAVPSETSSTHMQEHILCYLLCINTIFLGSNIYPSSDISISSHRSLQNTACKHIWTCISPNTDAYWQSFPGQEILSNNILSK